MIVNNQVMFLIINSLYLKGQKKEKAGHVNTRIDLPLLVLSSHAHNS